VIPVFFRIIRYLAVVVVMLLVWTAFLMVYFDWFVPPFNLLIPFLMPWKMIFLAPAQTTLEGRLDFMQQLLDNSRIIASTSFIVMAFSFMTLSGYAIYIYQQRQRRSRENELLQIKNQEIARRNEFIRYISATISHEFKNNVSRIRRRLEFVDFPAESKERINDNLERLFADIEIFKKISDEREAGLINFEMLRVKSFLQGIAAQYRDLMDVRFGDVAYNPVIFASKTLLQTVFENLLDNAAKYKRPEQEKAAVTFRCTEEEDSRRRYLTVSIRDEGLGMTEEQAERCFYKGSGTGGGWGEGLYFVKYAVGLHAGKVKVGKEYTAPGRGTEIIINLPLVEEAVHV
jgi:signal transduction histidine kinase